MARNVTRASSRSKREKFYNVVRVNPTDNEIRERFDRCVIDVTARGGTRSPQAICATSMRKAYGDQFQRIAAEGRSLAAAQRHERGMVLSRKTGRLERRPASRLRETAVQRRGIAKRVARGQAMAKRRADIELAQLSRVAANPTEEKMSWVGPAIAVLAVSAIAYVATRPAAVPVTSTTVVTHPAGQLIPPNNNFLLRNGFNCTTWLMLPNALKYAYASVWLGTGRAARETGTLIQLNSNGVIAASGPSASSALMVHPVANLFVAQMNASCVSQQAFVWSWPSWWTYGFGWGPGIFRGAVAGFGPSPGPGHPSGGGGGRPGGGGGGGGGGGHGSGGGSGGSGGHK